MFPSSVAPLGQLNDIPLVVDLDGTLIKTDLLYESLFDALSRRHIEVFNRDLPSRLSRNGIKRHLLSFCDIDHGNLPYNENVLSIINAARGAGRKVYLATASDRFHAEKVADHLEVFDGVFASDEHQNLKGETKARALVEAFGDGGFDYIGNDTSDKAIWRHARRAYGVHMSASLARDLAASHPDHVAVQGKQSRWTALVSAMRPHQYAKNGLIFVPLLTAHQFNLEALFNAFLAFIAFSLCASGVYLLNDLLDIQADRAHPTKRKRPFASGQLPIAFGMAFIPLLTLAAFALAWCISFHFFLTLLIYYVVTNAYSFVIKRRMIIDVVTLACLYTLRVFAGAAAIDVSVSDWLFTFSLLIFTALALLKRYIELAGRLDRQLSDPSNRNYKVADLPVIMALAAAAGMNSVMVIALYVSSDTVAGLYTHPRLLWGLCPLFLYWIARAVMLAHRRLMDDDPIAFALKDNRSWGVGLAAVSLVLAAL
ncbi:UbiA family prenyltransferase [Rhizobium glycinendophyticum]|uniref:UbiA family prenyltransferase n=1 Tax=Rhizobium glycinendophyticum TaxID=2589807 RepID=A0A504UBH5_9HYPH|nr:UbiA family prenyltransferase [Rhizobium glycinendophyticum]TPP06986.1 UbiA family prenyltransferase [Rhizobium glycinendophyticum]